MGFTAWVKSFLTGKIESVYVDGETALSMQNELNASIYATRVAISKIARTIAKCEFRTLRDGTFQKGGEYYLWNIRPGVNQNAVDFKIKLVTQMLLHNEALVIEHAGHLHVADSFSPHTDKALFEHYFDNVTVGGFTFNHRFYYSDVLYYRLDNENIRRWLDGILIQYDELTTLAASKYRRSGGRKGIARINATAEGDSDRKARLDKLFGSQFKSYYQSENSVLVLPNGVEYKEDSSEGSRRTASEVNDINSLVRETFCRVSQAFGIPLPLLFGDVADTSNAMDDFIAFAIAPICAVIETETNAKRYTQAEYLKGTKMVISLARVRNFSIFKNAANGDKLLSSGQVSVNELREESGLEQLPYPWADEHFITKNYESLNSMTTGGQSP